MTLGLVLGLFRHVLDLELVGLSLGLSATGTSWHGMGSRLNGLKSGFAEA